MTMFYKFMKSKFIYLLSILTFTNFYIPLLKIPNDCREDIFIIDSYEANMYEVWKKKSLHK